MKFKHPLPKILTAGLCACSPALGEAWPHFLGPHGDSTVRDVAIQTDFPDSGPPLVWEVPAGGGYSGPAVAGGKVFLMDRIAKPYQPGPTRGNPNFIRASIPGQERVRALDATTGATLWEHVYDCPYSTVYLYAIGPRSTPTLDEDRVYTLGAEGDLLCLSVEDGTPLWSRDFKRAYALEIPEWGCAAHPLVYGDLLICVVGGEGSTVVAFDKRSGEERWRALTASKPGYCPPVVASIHGREHLLIWHGDGLASLNPSDGSQQWYVDLKPKYGMSIGAPRVFGDLIHVMGFQGVSSAVRVHPDGESAQIEWGGDIRKGVAGVLNTAHLDSKGFLYSAGGGKLFRCVDIRNGQRQWESSVPLENLDHQRPGAWPSAFTNHHPPSGKTFIYNDHGEFIVAELTPDGYHERSRSKLMETTHQVGGRSLVWSAPAFAQSHLFLRNDRMIRCFDLSGTSPQAKLADRLKKRQRRWIDQGECLSHMVQVGEKGQVIYRHAEHSGVEGDPPVKPDTLFAIWSMTKPITSVAAMMLYEQGLFDLDEPVAKVIPILASFRVKTADGGTEALRRPITYRDLLRHTSGIYGYDGSFDEDGTWKQIMELDDLEEMMSVLLKQPLQHQPGARYTYGMSTAVLGYAIEKHTGTSLEAYLQQSIFTPLGMTQTKFSLTEEDRQRFQPLFVATPDGFRPGTAPEDELYYRPESRLMLGGEGLVSTMEDYGRFCQMLVDRGRTPEGKSLLKPQTLDIMLSDQLDGIPGFDGEQDGLVMGFGFSILKRQIGYSSQLPRGLFGWAGYHSTHFWIDPAHQSYSLCMTRRYPYHGELETQLKAEIYAENEEGTHYFDAGQPTEASH